MLTKQQKIEQIKIGKKLLDENKALLFVDFTGTSVQDLKTLRNSLKEIGAKLKTIKKKLMRIVFEKKGIDFNPEQFESQVGMIFIPGDISEAAGPVYKFAKDKEKKGFKILGAYDLSTKSFLDGETVVKIGKLPSREILLGQLVGTLASPIRMLMGVLKEKSKRS